MNKNDFNPLIDNITLNTLHAVKKEILILKKAYLDGTLQYGSKFERNRIKKYQLETIDQILEIIKENVKQIEEGTE